MKKNNKSSRSQGRGSSASKPATASAAPAVLKPVVVPPAPIAPPSTVDATPAAQTPPPRKFRIQVTEAVLEELVNAMENSPGIWGGLISPEASQALREACEAARKQSGNGGARTQQLFGCSVYGILHWLGANGGNTYDALALLEANGLSGYAKSGVAKALADGKKGRAKLPDLPAAVRLDLADNFIGVLAKQQAERAAKVAAELRAKIQAGTAA